MSSILYLTLLICSTILCWSNVFSVDEHIAEAIQCRSLGENWVG